MLDFATSSSHTHLDFWQIYMNMDNSSQNYWLRLLIREWAQFCIFLYIGYVMIPLFNFKIAFLCSYFSQELTMFETILWQLDFQVSGYGTALLGNAYTKTKRECNYSTDL